MCLYGHTDCGKPILQPIKAIFHSFAPSGKTYSLCWKKYVFCLLFGNGLTDFDVHIYQMIDWYLFSRKIHSKKLTKKVTKTGQKWHFSCFLACFRLCLKMAKISVKNKVKSRRKLKINKKMLRPIGYSMISNNVWKKKKKLRKQRESGRGVS